MSTTTRPCRAKNPASCRIHGTAHVTELYETWLYGDMKDNEGRWARAKAYREAEEAWRCGELMWVSSISHDAGGERLPCRLRKNHKGDHGQQAEPWQVAQMKRRQNR